MKRYPAYKDSEVEWLGRVPAHWSCVRIGAVLREVNEPGNDKLPVLSVSIHDGVSDRELGDDDLDRKVTRSEDRSKYKAVAPGDLTYNMMRAWQGGFGSVLVPGQVSPAYVVARPRNPVSTPFIENLLRTPAAVAEMKRHSRGVTDFRLRLYWEDFKAICIALPPPAEQQHIEAFITRETAKIDALIAEQEKLIALLAEKRQATISHAVTRGLDPGAPLKDSGVPWLGRVPAHWKVVRIKHVVRSIEQGWSPQCEGQPVEGEAQWGVLKVGCVNGGRFDPAENKRLPDVLEPMPDYGLRAHDLLVSRANTRELVGSAAVVERDFPRLLLCDKLYRLRLDTELCRPDFAAAYLGSSVARSQIQLEATGASSSMLNIGQGAVLDLMIALPPIGEQQAICQSINDETGAMRALEADATRAMALLRERRAALITAAVTGQIDVRGAVPA